MTKEELEDLNDFIDDEEFFQNAKVYEKVKKQRLAVTDEYMSAKQVSPHTYALHSHHPKCDAVKFIFSSSVGCLYFERMID